MRTIRNLLTVAGCIVASAVLAASASAAPAFQPLKLSKECSKYTGDIGSFCTITESNFAPIPVGTNVFYYGPMTGSPLFTSSSVVLDAGVGNTAIGHCIVEDNANPPVGMCAFSAGTGTLAGFQAIAKVTVDSKQIWHWDGGYVIGVAKAN